MRISWNVTTKVCSITAVSLACLLGLGMSSYVEFQGMVANSEELRQLNTALRNHLEGDMMHDALRADVLNALLTAARKGRRRRKGSSRRLGGPCQELQGAHC
jgi:methyl-accepting chemotaxis protein